MTEPSAAHWYPTAAYLYTLHLDGPALAWEYLRRHPDYRLDWQRRRRWPQASHRWGLRLLENPALDARDAHPVWFPDHDALVQLYPDADPPPGADAFAFWRIPGHKHLIHDGHRLVLVSRWPGSYLRLALAPGLEEGMAYLYAVRACATSCACCRALAVELDKLEAVAEATPAAAAHSRPAPTELLELHTLQALDAILAGASLREVAEGLFGADAVTADWHADSALRARSSLGAPWQCADARRLSAPGTASVTSIVIGGTFRPPCKTSLSKRLVFLETASIRPHWCRRLYRPMEVHLMRPAPLRPAAATVAAPAQPQRYLTNDEAAEYLRLSPRTLEKQRVIGGGPKFRKFGRRVMYAVSDLDTWADQHSYEATSDPEYAERHAGDYRDGR